MRCGVVVVVKEADPRYEEPENKKLSWFWDKMESSFAESDELMFKVAMMLPCVTDSTAN